MKKIYFLAPNGKGGTYYYYKHITDYLKWELLDEFEIIFCNSIIDYFKLHFIKSDAIFSIIPFLFKPLFCKKYIYNLHGNYKIERRKFCFWLKLLYLSELNLWFANKIMLTSYYLADKLKFKDKYKDKIIIIPNFIKEISNVNRSLNNNKINLLTVTNSNFIEKWMWVYHLFKELNKITDINFQWIIVMPWNNNKIIFDKFQNLAKNIEIKTYGFLDQDCLNTLYKSSDIFIYDSGLETRWWTIMEAMSFWLPIILLKNELWWYIYPNSFIWNSFWKRLREIIENYKQESDNSYNFIKEYEMEYILDKYLKNEILNNNTNI